MVLDHDLSTNEHVVSHLASWIWTSEERSDRCAADFIKSLPLSLRFLCFLSLVSTSLCCMSVLPSLSC
jgi:hypothetical protein